MDWGRQLGRGSAASFNTWKAAPRKSGSFRGKGDLARLRNADFFLNVNVIAPGRIFTEKAKLAVPELNEEAKRQTPLGRFGKPIEIAQAVLFLVSESSDFITGETLVINGGRTMR